MKNLVYCYLFLIIGCDDKLYRKKIDDGTIQIEWYYYSYISGNSHDFIDIIREDSVINVYESTDHIADVVLEKNKMIIREHATHSGRVYTKAIPKNIFGYQVIVDTTATFDEYVLRPHGKKYRFD